MEDKPLTPQEAQRPQAAPAARDAPREILRFRTGHSVQFFDRGRDAMDAMRAAIESAEQTVHLETYLLRGDRTGRSFLDLLAAKARSGVSVRLIVDAIGSRSLRAEDLAPLLDAGGQAVFFNPPSRWFWRFRPRQRDHRKLLIVDHRVAFLGGLNIADEYVDELAETSSAARQDALSARREAFWHDAHARLEGPAVDDLQAIFLEIWFRSGGASFDWRPLLDAPENAVGDASVAVLPDGPMYSRRRVRSFFLDELRRAQTSVLLVTPYFAPGWRVLEALESASARGVHVDILLAGQTDHPMLRRAARFLLPSLLRRGVRVYEDRRRMMHAKLAVFDDALSVIGTSNLDRQSLDHSAEANLVIEGEAPAKWIRSRFGPPAPGVVEIDADKLARESGPSRLFNRWIARWLDR